MNEKQLPVIKVEGSEAAKLADMASVMQDFTFVLQVCDRLIPLLEGEDGDPVLIRALWTAGLVAYVRSFATGKRHGLSEADIAELPGEPVSVHRLYKDLRDKHIAHSVNPFEEVLVGAILSADQPRKVEGVSTLARSLISHDVDGVKQLGWLANALRKSIARKGKEQEAAVLEWLKSLPIDVLESGEPLRSYVPGPEQARLARSGGDA